MALFIEWKEVKARSRIAAATVKRETFVFRASSVEDCVDHEEYRDAVRVTFQRERNAREIDEAM